MLVLLAAGGLDRPARAGFAADELFVPGVARTASFRSTLWITNLSAAPATVQIDLLVFGRSNPNPSTRTETLAAGATRRIDDVLGELFGISDTGAALRIRADREVFASVRTYDLPPGASPKDTKGLFFSGVPSGFAIGAGEAALLQGVSQGPGENFRYNFGLIETTGQTASVQVTLRDGAGVRLADPVEYQLGAFEALQVNSFRDFSPPVSATNGRLEILVTGGAGRVIAYGTQIAGTFQVPGSNDGSGFEMSFRNSLLGGGIRSIAAGTGLTGGGSGPNVTLAVAPLGVTTDLLAEASVTERKLADSISISKFLGAPSASGNAATGFVRIGELQIAWGSQVGTPSVSNPCARQFAFVFASPFAEIPAVTPGINNSDGGGTRVQGVYSYALNATGYSGSLIAIGDPPGGPCQSMTTTVSYIAIGRWR